MMMAYFKPLRRKIGVITLVLACVFAAGWVRGRYVCDAITIGGQGGYQCFQANCHGLMWFGSQDDPKYYYGDPFTYKQHFVVHPAKFYLRDETQQKIVSYQSWAGFHFSKSVRINDGLRISIWSIPYRSIVIPLTMLSTWLLLSRPRVKNVEPKLSPD